MWKLFPDADGWSKLQLKRNGKFLDAKYCSDELNINPGSTYDNGSCQLWKLVPDADGWSRLQIMRNGKYLDADQCSDNVKLSELSTFADGACQLWRFVPADDGWARLQIKFTGAPPAEAAAEEFGFGGNNYGWYDDGWNGPGWYIVGFERLPAAALAAAKAGTAGIITAAIRTVTAANPTVMAVSRTAVVIRVVEAIPGPVVTRIRAAAILVAEVIQNHRRPKSITETRAITGSVRRADPPVA